MQFMCHLGGVLRCCPALRTVGELVLLVDSTYRWVGLGCSLLPFPQLLSLAPAWPGAACLPPCLAAACRAPVANLGPLH